MDDELGGELGEVARALGNDRRRAVLDALIRSAVPLQVADLVERLGFHHLSIREHLAVLRQAGLVVEEITPGSGPGRPPHTYRPNPGALDRWTGAGPHAELAAMLLEVVGGRAPREVGAEVGRRLAADAGTGGRAAGAMADPLDRLDAVTRRMGFDPERGGEGDTVDLALHQCPFVDLALAAPGIVCELHRGIVEGVADGTGQGLRIRSLSLGAPPAEPCHLVVERS